VYGTPGSFGAPVKITAASSDPDAASTNSLGSQFIGDYNGADVGSNGTFWFTWTDTRNAATCAAVDAFRAGGDKPNIYYSCPAGFGNSTREPTQHGGASRDSTRRRRRRCELYLRFGAVIGAGVRESPAASDLSGPATADRLKHPPGVAPATSV
jgi:hypothetical protein